MSLLGYVFIGVLAVLGGGISYGVWRIRRKIEAWQEKRRRAKEAPAEKIEPVVDDNFPIFDVPPDDTPQPALLQPEPSTDYSAEFAKLHSAVKEIAKAQVHMIEAGGEKPSEDGEPQPQAGVGEAIAALGSELAQRIDELAAKLEVGGTAEGDDTAHPLLAEIAERPAGADIQAISDLLLPQIALLGEDVQRLEATVAANMALEDRIAAIEAHQGIDGAAPEPTVVPEQDPISDLDEMSPQTEAEQVLDAVGEAPDEAEDTPMDLDDTDDLLAEEDLVEVAAPTEETEDAGLAAEEVQEEAAAEVDATAAEDDAATEDVAADADAGDDEEEQAPKKLFGKGINYVPAKEGRAEKPAAAEDAADRMMV